MAFRKLKLKQTSSSDTIRKKPTPDSLSETDGPYTQGQQYADRNPKVQLRKQKQWAKMAPDKDLETAVLEKNFMFIGCNLPPDDMAPLMYDKQLLTQRENEEFQSMKRGHSSATDKSEHLLGCLLRRQAGSLQLFCDLIDEIPPAKHISERLKEDYKNAQIRRGRLSLIKSDSTLSPENRDRLSKASLSDPDIRVKDVAQQCTQCKVLERRNKKLDHRCKRLQTKLEELDKECYRLRENRLKVEAYVEMAKEQFKSSRQDRDKLKELVSKLQNDIVQLNTRHSNTESTLTKLDQLLNESKKAETSSSSNRLRPISHRDSLASRISSFSDFGEGTDDESCHGFNDKALETVTPAIQHSPLLSAINRRAPATKETVGVVITTCEQGTTYPVENSRSIHVSNDVLGRSQENHTKEATGSLVLGHPVTNVKPLPIEEHSYANEHDSNHNTQPVLKTTPNKAEFATNTDTGTIPTVTTGAPHFHSRSQDDSPAISPGQLESGKQRLRHELTSELQSKLDKRRRKIEQTMSQ